MTQLLNFATGVLPWMLLVLLALFMIRKVASWYRRVSPNTLAVISGRKHKYEVFTYPMKAKAGEGENEIMVEDRNGEPTKTIVERGFRYVVGGGTLVLPIIEQMQEMSLNIIQIDVMVNDVPDKDGVLVSVNMNANIKIKSDAQSAPLAIERFLGMSPNEIKEIAKNTLEGNLRNVTGKLTIEELRQDRQKFMNMVLGELSEDLGKMGLGVDGAQIQDIRDSRGYLDAIGKTKTAKTVNDARIGEAEAQRDGDIKSAAALQAGETAKAEADKNISDAQRDRDMAIADNEAKVQARRAVIPIAAEISAAERKKDLNVANVDAEKGQAEAEITLQEVVGRRNAAEYDATIVVKADKEREATVISADAARQAAELEGEASRIRAEKEGLGIQQRQTGEAQGRMKLAEANQAELLAQAEGDKAGLLAIAAGKQADLEAEGKGQEALAAGLQAKLLAEAAGVAAKAEAYSKLDATGRMLMLLAAIPPVIDSLGIAAERIAKPFADAIGEGLGNIDEVRLIDMGGNGGVRGTNMLQDFAKLPVETVYSIVQKLKATAFWPVIEGLAAQAGIDVEALSGTVLNGSAVATSEAASGGGASEEVSAEPASEATGVKESSETSSPAAAGASDSKK